MGYTHSIATRLNDLACAYCGGSGQAPDDVCSGCNGSGLAPGVSVEGPEATLADAVESVAAGRALLLDIDGMPTFLPVTTLLECFAEWLCPDDAHAPAHMAAQAEALRAEAERLQAAATDRARIGRVCLPATHPVGTELLAEAWAMRAKAQRILATAEQLERGLRWATT